MLHTTGPTEDEIADLCVDVYTVAAAGDGATWPPILGLRLSVVVTLAYLRKNRTQAELGEAFEVSQPTISRAIKAVTPLVAKACEPDVPTADELDPQAQYVVDGTLLPCWSWASHPELYSGKHKTTGLNVQIVGTLAGKLVWVSDSIAGSRHDIYCLRESGALTTLDPSNWIGDKGYVGNGMITPIKKPACRELLDWENEFNTQINKIRYVIERAIANIKTWRILHTDYRRPFETFATTISAVIGLQFRRLGCE